MLVALVGVLGSLVGGACGALVMAHCARSENRRWDARLGPVEQGIEGLREDWLRWQRRRMKRERDALQGAQSDDQQLPLGSSLADRKRAILARAGMLGRVARVVPQGTR